MMRLFTLSALAFGLAITALPAEAQRVKREELNEVVANLQTADLDTRAALAGMGAKITGLEADKAALSGKVETLEFLLGQSRDQINQMQDDDAEIGKLITRLEGRLSQQDSTIRGLEAKLSSLQAQVSAQASAGSIVSQSDGSALADTASGSVTRTVSGGDGSVTRTVTGPSTGASSTTTVTSGPVRIVRRSEDGTTTTTTRTVTSGPSSATGSTTQGRSPSSGGASLPQGTLGTIPASALPGEAGPLFAEAKTRFLQFDYRGAETAFRAFLEQFGSDPQAGEALYWLAEALYQQEAYADSGQIYTQMIRQYPDDPRAPEALAKLARSMRLVGDTEKACNALNLLPQRYPDASGVTKNLVAGERVRSGCDS